MTILSWVFNHDWVTMGATTGATGITGVVDINSESPSSLELLCSFDVGLLKG